MGRPPARPADSADSMVVGRRIPLRTKLMFLMVLTTAATLLVATTMLYLADTAQFRTALGTSSQNDVAPEIKRQWDALLPEAGASMSTKVLERGAAVLATRFHLNPKRLTSGPSPKLAEIWVVDSRNTNQLQVVYHARFSATNFEANPNPSTLPVPELVRGASSTSTNRLHRRFYEIAEPILAKGGDPNSPQGFTLLKYDLSAVFSRRNDFLAVAVIVVLISLLTGWLLSSRLENVITRPITQLAQATVRVTAANDYSPRLRHPRNDELGDLVAGFNAMLSRIEQRDAELRQANDCLQQAHQELQQAHQELERRVEQRTNALTEEVRERRRAQKDLSQQLARISLLNQITQAIANRQDLESVVSVVLSELTLHLPADFGCALLLEAGQSTLQVACCRERELETAYLAWKVDNWSIPLEGSGWETPEDGPLFVQGDLLSAGRTVFTKPAQLGMQTAGALPLRYEKSLIGLLLVARRNADGFTPGEQEFLRSTAEHVSLAGHQARLYADLQKAYNELRQTQHTVMQHERLRALGQMASGVAHDINNALSPVSGFAELLLSTEANLGQNARKYLNFIRTASDDVAHLVSRLREFYRSRELEQPLLPVSLDALAEQVVELTRPRWRDLAQRRGVDVQVLTDFAPDTPKVVGIETELREALTNLVFNAIDAMPSGGTIAIRTRKITRASPATEAPQTTHVVLEVVDTGTGMDEETRKRCLEPFFSTKGQRGTGLGLAMVYGTMQRHNGSIEVESEKGRGTVIRLVFPTSDIHEVSTTEAPPTPARLSSLRILFVDDEPLLRELIREILETDGHSVTTADGGPAGLEMFRRLRQEGTPPDVVITDLGMPQLDGRELTRLIKQESPDTPVIMMTGWGKMMRKEEEIRAPVDALISKPPRIAELQEALQKVVRPLPTRPA